MGVWGWPFLFALVIYVISCITAIDYFQNSSATKKSNNLIRSGKMINDFYGLA